ncbi:hypothetical protein DPEC_G00111020 [Dallia pectoralis]|uniref:Uncharacterized protein n=1 Tax=Dallia pectoralis TaxID=75939 RepID=A0ACC2GT36_DALPE|nr:hypothetical protein DPEC_G00111020 [Dallia pectoralis]
MSLYHSGWIHLSPLQLRRSFCAAVGHTASLAAPFAGTGLTEGAVKRLSVVSISQEVHLKVVSSRDRRQTRTASRRVTQEQCSRRSVRSCETRVEWGKVVSARWDVNTSLQSQKTVHSSVFHQAAVSSQ